MLFSALVHFYDRTNYYYHCFVSLVEGSVQTDSIDVTLASKCTDASALLKTYLLQHLLQHTANRHICYTFVSQHTSKPPHPRSQKDTWGTVKLARLH